MELIVRNAAGIVGGILLGHSILGTFPGKAVRWQRGLFYGLLALVFILPSWFGDENPILLFPFFALGCFFCLPGKRLPRMVVCGIVFTLLISLNILMDSLYWNDWTLYLLLLIRLAVWCVLSWFLRRIVPCGGLQLSKKLWLLLGGLSLAPLVTMLSFSLYGYRWPGNSYDLYRSVLQMVGYTSLPFIFVSALTLLIAAAVLSRHEALEQENRLAALREVYYTGLKQEQTGLRTLRHDLKNHVTALQGLLEQGRQTELSRYLADLAGSPALESDKHYTKNETANVVLCGKAAHMEALAMLPDFAVSLPERLALSDIDLCALLGNALDNAMEGVADAENKTITLGVRLDKGMFMLQVQNAMGAPVNADLTTTKKDAAQHGFGLAGMREIAVRQGGSLEASVKDDVFTLLVCFPCEAFALS